MRSSKPSRSNSERKSSKRIAASAVPDRRRCNVFDTLTSVLDGWHCKKPSRFLKPGLQQVEMLNKRAHEASRSASRSRPRPRAGASAYAVHSLSLFDLTKLEIPRPALLLDLNAFEAKVARAAGEAAAAGALRRPRGYRQRGRTDGWGWHHGTAADFPRRRSDQVRAHCRHLRDGGASRAPGAVVQEAAGAANLQVRVLVDPDTGDHRTA